MDLHKFPLDKQNCPLEIGSFGHETSDIVYKWMKNPIAMDDDIKKGLAQYNLVSD